MNFIDCLLALVIISIIIILMMSFRIDRLKEQIEDTPELKKRPPIHHIYLQFCKERKISGSILVSSRIKEFFDHYESLFK